MPQKRSLSDYGRLAVYYLGWVTLYLLLFVSIFALYIKIDSALTHTQLDRGYVVRKCYDDGHYWYSSYVFGDYSITKRHGGEAYFYIEVRDGSKSDYWHVSLEEYDALSVGDYIMR